jgi:phytoene dehydrogenase-like protein
VNPLTIVVGAGVNERVCAHYLARAGRQVIVLEGQRAQNHASSEPGWVPPRIARELDLKGHGLEIHAPDPWIAAPLPQGGRLELWRDMARSVEAIRRLSPKDAQAWPAFCERMARLARLLEALYSAAPPNPMGRGFGEIARLAGAALRAGRLGRQGIEDLLRILPMPAADLLDDWFENDVLKGILGAGAVMHQHQGPRAGGTALALLHHHAGCPAGVFRPPWSNIRRVLAEPPGAEIRRCSELTRIDVRDGRVSGVALADGEEIAGSLVICGADPRRVLLEYVAAGSLDPEFARAVRHIRSRGVVGQVSLTLDRAPGFEALVVAPSLDYLERAHDDAKYGRVSQRPYLEARSTEPGADGTHRVEVHVQYAPYALRDGAWDTARRAALGQLARDVLLRHVPGVHAALAGHSVRSPRDLEDLEGFPEGQTHHAELALDQFLWLRPLPGWANYRTPIGGLYLCGPGTHPGAGVAGASGYHCAQAVLRDLKRRAI